jgi:hypothetical protein
LGAHSRKPGLALIGQRWLMFQSIHTEMQTNDNLEDHGFLLANMAKMNAKAIWLKLVSLTW